LSFLSKNIEQVCDEIIGGNRKTLAKAITLIESNSNEHRKFANKILSKLNNKKDKSESIRIGITGIPGAGKSTFIESLGTYLLNDDDNKIAVLAIDPSSRISKGSILGDKTRMSKLSNNPNVFIRPTAASNFQGGIAKNTRESIFLCEAAGFNIIFIETVGVGQNEISVFEMVDFFLLLKIAGSGDELQGIKRGIIEMSDLIVINKTDGDNINKSIIAKNEFQMALKLFSKKESEWMPEVMNCSSIENNGIIEIWDKISNYFKLTMTNNYFYKNRIKQNKYWLREIINQSIIDNFYLNERVRKEYKNQLKKINENKVDVFEAYQKIILSQKT
jgi:LAO/AO transport system kinase